MPKLRFLDRMRAAAARWRTASAIAGTAALCELGARVGLPGVAAGRVADFLRTTHLGLLAIYDFLVGGGVSRAAILAVGAVPYLQAKLYLWLARAAFPSVRRATENRVARRSVTRATTVALAVIQSFGFAVFLERLPGAVTTPGAAFVSRTVLLLTGSSVLVGWLAERLAEKWSAGVRDDLSNTYESTKNADLAPTSGVVPGRIAESREQDAVPARRRARAAESA